MHASGAAEQSHLHPTRACPAIQSAQHNTDQSSEERELLQCSLQTTQAAALCSPQAVTGEGGSPTSSGWRREESQRPKHQYLNQQRLPRHSCTPFAVPTGNIQESEARQRADAGGDGLAEGAQHSDRLAHLGSGGQAQPGDAAGRAGSMVQRCKAMLIRRRHIQALLPEPAVAAACPIRRQHSAQWSPGREGGLRIKRLRRLAINHNVQPLQ